MSEFQFDLSKPVEYAHKGQQTESTFITFKEPGYKHLKQCVPLKQAFYRVAVEAAGTVETTTDTPAADTTAELEPDVLVAMFYQSGAEDMYALLLQAVALFRSPQIALLGGEEALTDPLFEKISPSDLERMFGEYMVRFILASALNKGVTNSG